MKRLISILVSGLILWVIYGRIDFAGLGRVFQECDRGWMAISLGMVVPLTGFTAWRLQQLMPRDRQAALGFGEANQLILAASVLNMVLPSKMGDIAKAYFMRDHGHLDGSLAFSLVVFEKTCDLLSLLLWCVFGLALYPRRDWLFGTMTAGVALGLLLGAVLLGSPHVARCFFQGLRRLAPKRFKVKLRNLNRSWGAMHDYFWSDRRQLTLIALTSVFIWFLHLLQIWLFTLALKTPVPVLSNLALAPLAILAGLLPLTFAGVGTRDAALILFYAPYMNAPAAAALGLLCTSRYLMPAIGGLPFLGKYLAAMRTVSPLR
ncbi:MAG: hypothetical protein Fur0042_30740 [Cyanophyceae cyanobacterium]